MSKKFEKLDEETIEKIERYWRQWDTLRKQGTPEPKKKFAELAGVSYRTFYKYKPDDIELEEENGKEDDVGMDEIDEKAQEKAESEVTKKIVKNIGERATVEHQEILKIGEYVKDKYGDMARSYGLKVEDFIDGAVNFWDLNKDRIKELEMENKKMEFYIKSLVKIYSKAAITERILNNAVAMSLLLNVPIDKESLREVMKLVEDYDSNIS